MHQSGSDQETAWGQNLTTGCAALMGIVNVTPDSFSDGGSFADHRAAIAHGQALAAAGAAWVDVGGESTRPGAAAVTAAEELRRVVPVVSALADAGLRVSIDTQKAAVAEAACAAGARLINDVSGGADPALLAVAAERQVGLCLMHMQGQPATMQDAPSYQDVVAEVIAFLHSQVRRAVAAGVALERILVDPGIGFGKTLSHNLALLEHVEVIAAATACPVLVGCSRKRMLPALLGRDVPVEQRDGASHLLHAQLARRCAVLRVHDVAGARDALACSLDFADSSGVMVGPQ